MPSIQDVLHVCLAGRLVSNDWELIRSLRSRYLVTLMDNVDFLARRGSMLKETQLLVLDCSRSVDAALACLPRLKQEFPDLCMVLVDGGLNQLQIASAFKEGVKDYFASPYDVALLVERVDSLCARLATQENPQSP